MGAPEPGVGTGIRSGLLDTGILPMNGSVVQYFRAEPSPNSPGECGVNYWPNGPFVTTPCDGGVKPAWPAA
jgi:hypothetical protein